MGTKSIFAVGGDRAAQGRKNHRGLITINWGRGGNAFNKLWGGDIPLSLIGACETWVNNLDQQLGILDWGEKGRICHVEKRGGQFWAKVATSSLSQKGENHFHARKRKELFRRGGKERSFAEKKSWVIPPGERLLRKLGGGRKKRGKHKGEVYPLGSEKRKTSLCWSLHCQILLYRGRKKKIPRKRKHKGPLYSKPKKSGIDLNQRKDQRNLGKKREEGEQVQSPTLEKGGGRDGTIDGKVSCRLKLKNGAGFKGKKKGGERRGAVARLVTVTRCPKKSSLTAKLGGRGERELVLKDRLPNRLGGKKGRELGQGRTTPRRLRAI